MPDKIKFGDVGSDYEPSDSDGEYSEGEREILRNVRRRGRDQNQDDENQEEAVLGFDDEDDDEEPDFDEIRKFEHDSDIEEGGEEDDLPDRYAWGSKASAFYGTGYTDQDYDTLTAQEEELAQLEEAEALEIQKRLIQGMTAEDFQLDLLVPTEEGGAATDETAMGPGKSKKKKQKDGKAGRTDKDAIVIKGDLSDLSERQQRELFRKDAPEFDGLVNDFATKMSECIQMEPVLTLLKTHNKLQHPFGQLLNKRYQLSLLYCNNINFYVLLKSQKVHVRNHPLVKRLLQLKRLVQEVEQKYEQSIKAQVEELLVALEDGEDISFPSVDTKRSASNGKANDKKTHRLKTLARLEERESAESESQDDDDGGFEDESETEAPTAKRFKLGANEDDSEDDDAEQDEEHATLGDGENVDEEGSEEDGDEKRKITYQMAKNKGLTVRKRKDQRNVRVKNKQKYRKALIRRKGAVRPVRTELQRYSGEASIKAFVKRGIKIK